MSSLSDYGIRLKDPDYDPFATLMALGDGYVDGKWECDDLGATLYQLTRSRDIVKLVKDKSITVPTDEQAERAQEVIDIHYDMGNDLFRAMLDRTMSYTCAYWRAGASTLEAAQSDKNELICQKLELEPGMVIADLGCGFGSFARHAQDIHDVTVIGYTLSQEQADIAGDFMEVRVADYTQLRGRYDRIISMGMLEHVGPANYRDYMKVNYRHLEKNGIALFQTIGYNLSRGQVHPWINTHIFPNGALGSFAQLAEAMEGLFVLEDVENFGTDYATTAQAWFDNFARAVHSGRYRCHPRFYRMWEFYIMFFKAAFLAREFQLWQVVMTKQRLYQPRRV